MTNFLIPNNKNFGHLDFGVCLEIGISDLGFPR